MNSHLQRGNGRRGEVHRILQGSVVIEIGSLGPQHVHLQKLTWNLEMMVSNRNLLFQGSIFRFHVCFGGCNPKPIFGDGCQ